MRVLVWMLLQALQAASCLLLSCKATKVLQAWESGRHVCPGWLLLLQRCRPLLLCNIPLRTPNSSSTYCSDSLSSCTHSTLMLSA
jgi:hypothetical protein